MTDTIASTPHWVNIHEQQRRADHNWYYWYFCLMGMTGLFALIMVYTKPSPILLGGVLFLASVAVICYQPRIGIYMMLFFTLLGDKVLVPWYPFAKNLSSAESLLYINDALIFSPLEFYLILTLIAWLGRSLIHRSLAFFRGELFWPAMIVAAFLVSGFVYGLATGGNVNIALWEVRPIFYLPVILIVVSNLIKKRKHVSHLMWTIMSALFIEGIIGSYHYFVNLRMSLAGVESITEHSAAIHMNTLFVFILTTWMYKASAAKRFLLPLMAPAVALTYIATQRRAAFLSLGIALMLIAIIIYVERRQLFWSIVPIAVVAGLCYVAIFWNSNSALALPAQALKSVIAPDPTSKDTASNLYRKLENTNISFTVHNAPIMGVGFGQKFHIIIPMPDISSFIWWEYIVHNSVLWIWLKTGLLGFMAMLFFMGYSIMSGVRGMQRITDGELKAVAVTATIYLMMHFSYTYVDMAWDTQSMLYLGTMMGLINRLDHIAAEPIVLPPKRWPWQSKQTSMPRPCSSSDEGYTNA